MRVGLLGLRIQLGAPKTGAGSTGQGRQRGCAMLVSRSPLPVLQVAQQCSSVSFRQGPFCILGFLSIIDGSIVKTLPDPGMCVKGKRNQ